MKDVYLINPPQPKPDITLLEAAPISPPLGLSYLAGTLKPAGISITAFDFDLKSINSTYFIQKLVKDKPKIAGITCLTNTFLSAVTLAKLIKMNSPETLVVLGGQHATFCFEDVLSFGVIDVVVLGEGEETFLQLCMAVLNNADYTHIKGIAFRDEDNNLLCTRTAEVDNLDEINFPDRSIFNMKKYYDPINIISSRGCSSKCIFCSASAFRKSKAKFRSAENVLEEIGIIYRQGFRTANFMDDNFLLKKQRIDDICNGIRKKYPKLFWTCSARADCISEDNIKLLAASGCKGLHFGLETSSKESLKDIGKYLSIDRLEKALTLAYKHRIKTFCSLIIGLPNEDHEQILHNIDYAVELNNKYNASMVFGILTPYPGTPIYNESEKFGITIHSNYWPDYDIYTPVISTKHFEKEDLRALLFEAQKKYLSNLSEESMEYMAKLAMAVCSFG